ncbi:MAG: hypothetical protein AAFV49_10605 [Pseudomonadota bacterium]
MDWHRRLWEHQDRPLAQGSPYAEFVGPTQNSALPWLQEAEIHNPQVLRYIRDEDQKHATIRVSVRADLDGTCAWSGAGLKPDPKPCRVWQRTQIALAGDRVSVQAAGQSYEEHLSPEHLVIVGMGGSYGAGEGNPDRPTRWKPDFMPDRASFGWLHNSKHYVGGTEGAAAWLDNDCHRSFFGYQNLVALALASEDPHRFVTFLHYACTGADFFFGHLAPQGSPGPADDRGFNRHAQINSAIRELCRESATEYVDFNAPGTEEIDLSKFVMGNGFTGKAGGSQDAIYRSDARTRADTKSGILDCPPGALRVPDLLLLEAGGNEIGFSSLVQFWIVPHSWTLNRVQEAVLPRICPGHAHRGIVGSDVDEYCDKEPYGVDELIKGRAGEGALDQQFDYFFETVRFYLKIEKDRIVHKLYPDPLRNRRDANPDCKNMTELDAFPGDNSGSNPDSAWNALKATVPGGRVIGIRDDEFNLLPQETACLFTQVEELRNVMRAAAERHDVRLVEGTRDAFVDNDWTKGDKRFIGLPGFAGLGTKPSEWEPYRFEPTGRAIRTSNDSYLTQGQGDRRNYYGTAHPNLLGHVLITGEHLRSDALRGVVPAPTD